MVIFHSYVKLPEGTMLGFFIDGPEMAIKHVEKTRSTLDG
jgi:hypothetical protein